MRRPTQFQAVREDMLEARHPASCRRMAAALGVNKMTVWRWRQRINGEFRRQAPPQLEGAATVKRIRESRKASREWVDHRRSPLTCPAPDRPRWVDVDRGRAMLPRPLWTYQRDIRLSVDPGGKAHAAVVPEPRAACSNRWHSGAVAPCQGAGHAIEIPKSHSSVTCCSTDGLRGRFERFLRPFRGPAARHLDGYAAWFAAHVNHRNCGSSDRDRREPPTG